MDFQKEVGILRGYIDPVSEFEGSEILSYLTRKHVDKKVFRAALLLEFGVSAPLEKIQHKHFRLVPSGLDSQMLYWPSEPGRGAFPVTLIDTCDIPKADR